MEILSFVTCWLLLVMSHYRRSLITIVDRDKCFVVPPINYHVYRLSVGG